MQLGRQPLITISTNFNIGDNSKRQMIPGSEGPAHHICEGLGPEGPAHHFVIVVGTQGSENK